MSVGTGTLQWDRSGPLGSTQHEGGSWEAETAQVESTGVSELCVTYETPKELEEGFLWVNEQIYKPSVMYEKLMASTTWYPPCKPERLKHKAFVLLRLAQQLPAVDWETREFILKSAFHLTRPRTQVPLTRVVNALDHIDFAQSLSGYGGHPPRPPGERAFEILAAIISGEVRASGFSGTVAR